MMKHFLISITAAISMLLLQACGGGGGGDGTGSSYTTYSGLTTEAKVETTNSEDLSTAAASGALQAVAADSASGALGRPTPSLENKLLEVSPKISKWIVQSGFRYAAKTTDISSEVCDAGGTAIADTNDAETVGTITFSSCGMSDGSGGTLVLNGTVDYTYTVSSDSIVMTYHVTVTYAGETSDMNMTLSCVDFTSASPTCSASVDYVGLDSRVYRVKDIDVSGSEASGFYVSATVYDPDHGYVEMTTNTPITFECDNGVPGTGAVTLAGSDSTSATITFVSCSEYNVTIDGLTETYNW
jgi:hypothetical protein